MEIGLTQGKVAHIEAEDWPLIAAYRWYAVKCDGKFYAQAKKPGTKRSIYLHRHIMGASPNEEVDHRDGDSLNFRRSNLRVADSAGNNRNVGKRSGLSSRFKGVHWHKAMGRWQSKIKVNGKAKHLGYFTDEEAAARSYDEASRQFHQDFGRTNFPTAG